MTKTNANYLKKRDRFSGSWLLLIGLVVVYIVIVVGYIIRIISDVDILTIGLAFVAVAIASFSLMAQFVEKTVVEVNFNRMMKLCCDEGKKLEENERPLLKALIKIKAKNKEFDLEQIYKLNRLIFNNGKLIERLYE